MALTTAVSNQGGTVRIDSESALGTADNGIDLDIRLAGEPTWPPVTRELTEQPNVGHENAGNVDDKPIVSEKVQPSSMTLPINVRRAKSTNIPPLTYMLQSGGWTTTDSVADTVTTGTADVDDFDCTASIFGAADTYGAMVLVETVANTTWEPALIAKYDDAPDKQCVPVMDLPSMAAIGGDVIRMRTSTVNAAPVGVAETLSVVGDNRGEEITCSGCALADLGEININQDGAVVLNPVFHVADAAISTNSLGAESYLDGYGTDGTISYLQLQNQTNFKVQMGVFAAAGGITNASIEIESAVIRPNITTEVVPGFGSSSCVNGAQAYMQIVAAPEVDITFLRDDDFLNDGSKGIEAQTANQFTYIGFVWATDDINKPASAIILPKCYQWQPPTYTREGHSQLMTVHYKASSPAFTGGATSNGSTAMSPIYIGIHGQD